MGEFLFFGIITGFSHFVYSILGFGSTFLAFPFLVYFWDVKIVVPSLFILSLIVTIPLLIGDRKHLEYKHLRAILIPALLGIPLGLVAFSKSSPEVIKRLFGVLIFLWLLSRFRQGKQNSLVAGKKIAMFFSFLGGAIEGAISSGGPFFAVSVRSLVDNKSAFRANLLFLWFVTDSLWLIAYFLIYKNPVEPILAPVLTSLPFVLGALWIGNHFHGLIKPKMFFKIVTALLVLAAAMLVI